MKKALTGVLSIILTLGLIGCTVPASAEVLKSDKDRVMSPEVGLSDLATLVEGNSQFAFDLYQALKDTDDNLFYSPYSISLALAMTYAGARGETEAQMAETLNYLLSQQDLHPAFNSLDLELAKRGKTSEGKDGEGFRLNIANSIWGQKDYDFLDSYLDLLAENYGAGLRVLDFIADPESSRETINQWVSDETEGRIKDLIPEGGITTLTRLVLTNAIYFNAAWATPFAEEATADGKFYLEDGTEITVPMMKQAEHLGYAEADDYLAVELPYDGNELSMVVITNQGGSFSDFENNLTWEAVQELIGSLESTNVAFTMPKFEFESLFGLRDTLYSMGMEEAFLETADFSGMNGQRDLMIHDVVHKSFVSVDEAGTEAAAATGVIVGIVSIPADPIEVTLDSPFTFLIRDIETGTILFVGKVANPGL